MSDSCDTLVKRKYVTIYDFAEEFDTDTADRFRTYKGKYPREGYDKTRDNPFNYPSELRKPPPLRK